jgi:predicted transcriptional regulator
MSTTLSIRLDSDVRTRLEELAQRTKRSKSFLAAEAIAAYVEAEDWQLEQTATGLVELDGGKMVSHEKVSKWLRSWGKPAEGRAPR